MENDFNGFKNYYGLDIKRLVEIKKYFLLSDEDKELLRSVAEKIKEIPEVVFDDFYSHLLSFEETKRILTKEESLIERLKEKQKDYLKFLLLTDIDENYVKRAFNVGKKHFKYGVPLGNYIGAYAKYREAFLEHIKDYFSSEEMEKIKISFTRKLFIDIYFVIKAYYYFEILDKAEQVKRYEAIRETSLDGIVLMDIKRKRIIDVNKAIENFIG